jgi:hypothetical protein
MEGYKMFSNLLDRAFSGAEQGISKFDNSVSDRVNNEIMTKLLQEQDPNAFRDKLASGEFLEGVDPRRVRASTISALASRPTDLLEQAKGFRANRIAQADDRAASVISQLAEAAGNDAKQTDILAANPEWNQGMSASQILGYNKDIQGLNRGRVGLEGDRLTNKINQQSYDQSGTRFSRESTEWENNQAADIIRQQIWNQTGGEPDATEALIRGLSGKVNPHVLSKVTASFGLNSYRDFGSGGMLGGGGGSTAAFDYVSNPGAWSSVPVEVGKALGLDPMDVASVMSFETGGKMDPKLMGGAGGNYMGLIQFGPEERRKYGINANSTPEQWTSAITNFMKDRGFKNGMGIEDFYSTILTGSPGNYDRKDANGTSVRNAIPKILNDHRSNAERFLANALPGIGPTAARSTFVQQGIEPVMAESPLVTQYAQTSIDTSSPKAVADKLRKGSMSGITSAWIVRKIQDVQARALKAGHRITAATAGSIVEGSLVSQGPISGYFKAGDFTIDDDMVDQQINLVTSNKLATAVNAYQRTARSMDNLAGGEAMLKQAQSRLINAQRRGIRDLSPFLRDVAMAQAIVNQASGAVDAEQELLRPDRRSPAPKNRSNRASETIAQAASRNGPKPTAFARDSRGNFKQQGSAGSRARASEILSEIPSGVGSFIANYNPASLLLRSILGN